MNKYTKEEYIKKYNYDVSDWPVVDLEGYEFCDDCNISYLARKDGVEFKHVCKERKWNWVKNAIIVIYGILYFSFWIALIVLISKFTLWIIKL